MKKLNQKLSTVVFLLIVLFSCNENEIHKDLAEDEVTDLSVVGIESIRNATSHEIDIAIKFLSDYSVSNNKDIKITDFEEVEIVTYTDMPGKTFILNFSNEGNYNSHSLIVVVGLEDEIISAIEYVKVENNDTYSVSLNYGSFEFLTAEISKEGDTMLNYNFKTNPKGRMATSWGECMETAASACVSDGECAFLCGIIWQYCIGALVTACTYIALK